MASPARGSITTSASMMDKKTQWDATQKQTFTRWANQYLLDRLMEMKNLYEDIGNGLLLGNLAEVISNKKVLTKMAKNPRFQMQKLENLGIVLAFFESEGLKFVNVDPDAMLSGNSKLALGFMWTIILRYAINRGDGEGGKSARAEILDWMAAVSQEPCKNFGCLRDGRILSKIVNHCSQLKGVGNLIDDPDALDRSKGLANNDAAIHKAHDHLGVPMLVDADVFDTDTPEELSSMTYISCYRQLEAKLKEGGEPAAVFAASIELPESIVDGESVTFDTTILCDGEPFTEPTQAAAVESVTVECVAADGGASIPVNVAPSSPIGPTYQCTFVAPAPGDYSLVARRRMKPLAGTPQPFTVLAAVPTINVSVDGDVAKRPVRVQVSASSPRGDILPCSCRVTDANGNQLPIDGDGSFTPLAAGTYTITPVVDGKPIESDATSIVIGEPQLSAEVDAPTSATTGEPLVTKVTLLNAGDPMGEGGEEVKVNGAPATDNGDGTYTATVTPDDPGKFVLSVTGKDDAPLCDPVTVDVASDVASLKLDGAGASPTVAKHAVELDGVFVDHLGRGVTSEVPCSITAKDGNGAPVDVSVKVLDDKTGVVASFTPATPGEYTLTPSKGEPVSVTVTAPQLTAEVDTPTSATTGEPLVTKVTLLNAGDPMGEGGEEVKVNGAPATDNGDGTYTATVTPDDPGKFVLSVTGKDDAPLCDPVTVDVASDVPAIQFDGDEVDPSCAKHTVSVRGTFVDHLGRTVKGGDGETPTVQITDPANVTVPSTLKPLDDDTGVTVTFTPMISGEYTLTPSKGESVSLKIDEPAFSATFDVPATGTTGVALSANLVLLNAGDPVKDGGEHVVVEGAESVKDNGDGTYTVSVVPQNPGNLLLFPSCNGKPLCDSACIVVAADAPVVSVTHENTSDGPAVAKHPVRCRARARNNRDEPVANAVDASTLSVVDPNGNTIPATFTKDDDGNTLVEFFPNQPGDYTVTPANGDPYVVHIGDSDLSATLTAPLSAIAGRPFEVRLSLVNAGDPMTTSVGDDQPVFVNGAKAIDNGDGTYTAKLTAESAGDFTIAPVCASKALCAPTTIPVAADVPHLELLDARAPLVAQLPVVCPGQFKDHAGSPVDPDASAVTVVDSNGNSVPFTLNATDPPVVGAVELTFTPKTPGSYIVRPCNGQELAVDIAEASLAAELSMPERWIAGETSKVLLSLANAGVAMNEGGEPVRLDSAAACVDNGDGTYTASFPNLKEGDLILAPTAHDKPLLESPVTVTVLPRPVGHAEGPGIQQAVSNRRATFSLRIDNDDSGDEAVPSVSVSDSQEVTVESMGDGMHVVQYTPVVSSGTVAVTGTTASGIELFAEPILVPVRPGMRLVVKGPGLENPTTGTANAFNVNVLNDAGQPVLDLPENAICVQATVEGPGAVEVVRSGNRRRVSEMSRSGNKRLSSQSVSDAAPAYLSYVFAYTTETPGDYVVAVDIDDSAEDRVETPVTVRRFVHGVASGAGLITPRVAAVNEFVVATVDHAGQGLNHGGIDVAATLRSLDDPDAAPVACDVVDHGDGKYTCSYMTGVDGEHAVDVLVDGRPVEMSPFYVNVNNQVTASPAVSVIMSDAGAADTSRIAHLGLQGPAEGKPRVWLDQGRHTVAYDVTTPGRYSVVVSGCENIDVSLDDGTPAMAEPSSEDDPTERTLTFVAQGDPSKPVLATVNIGLPASLPLVPLPTVPSFPAVAAAPALSATAVNLGGAGITHPYTDVRNPVTIGLVQDAVPLPPSAVQEHAVDLVVVGPSAVSKAPLVIDDNDAIVRYTVSEPGEYHLSAVVDGMSTGDESSRTVTVSDTVRVRQSGPGLTGALPDEENTFTVQLVDKAGHELTPASGAGCLPMDLSFVSGPVDEATVTVQDKGDGTYECSYVPTAVAPMSYSLKLDGVKEVHGSPFPIKMDEHLAKARASARAEKDRRAAEEARRREQEEREQAEKRRLVAEARRKAADAKAEKLRLAAANRRSAIETQEANRRAAEERAAAEAEAARQRREQVEAARAAAEAARLAAEQRRLEEEARRHAEAEEEARRQAEASRLASTLSPSKIPVASPKKKAAYKPVKGDAMDEEVAKVLNALGIEGVRKGDRPGKYHLGDMVLLIRVLRTGCMVRVGGGWEKLETFLKMHAKQVQQAKTSPCPPRRSAPANSRLTTSVGAAGIQQKHTSLSALRAMQDKADKAKK